VCTAKAHSWFFGMLVAILMCAGSFTTAEAQALAGRTWAIVIGVSRYGDPSLSERSLRYAESDAQEIRDALIERCNVPQQNVHLLKGSKATKSGIERAFASVAKSARSSDLVFIYFSGHGSFVQDRDGDEVDGDRLDEVLLPYDAVLGDESTYIIDDSLGYMVSRLPASSVAIIIDSCHSAGQGKSVPTPGLLVKGTGDSFAKDIFTDAGGGTGRALLSACQSGEVAYENEDLGHGVLTYFVLQSLEQVGADRDRNGALTFDELGAFVEERVDAWCLQNGVFQTPSYESKSATPIIIVPRSVAGPGKTVLATSSQATSSPVALKLGAAVNVVPIGLDCSGSSFGPALNAAAYAGLSFTAEHWTFQLLTTLFDEAAYTFIENPNVQVILGLYGPELRAGELLFECGADISRQGLSTIGSLCFVFLADAVLRADARLGVRTKFGGGSAGLFDFAAICVFVAVDVCLSFGL
jgi:hypothetical protein